MNGSISMFYTNNANEQKERDRAAAGTTAARQDRTQ
jgi:hypothetical protein